MAKIHFPDVGAKVWLAFFIKTKSWVQFAPAGQLMFKLKELLSLFMENLAEHQQKSIRLAPSGASNMPGSLISYHHHLPLPCRRIPLTQHTTKRCQPQLVRK
jgi:hypothetical protein